jgi:hypothetical protein
LRTIPSFSTAITAPPRFGDPRQRTLLFRLTCPRSWLRPSDPRHCCPFVRAARRACGVSPLIACSRANREHGCARLPGLQSAPWPAACPGPPSEDDPDRAKRAIRLLSFLSTSRALRACVVARRKTGPWHANAVGTACKKRPASLMPPRPARTSVTSKGIGVAFDLKAQAYEAKYS